MAYQDRLKLTSVKIHKDLSENFKVESAKTGLSLQKFVNRTIHLYLTDPDFKVKMLTYNHLATSGSL
jgi:predicted DNA binding CopG/RHH family protein